MQAIYLDLHIHTSANPNQLNQNYNLKLLTEKIREVSQGADFLISLTDHNTINKTAYLQAVSMGINIIVGAELHIKNYDESPAYHCHIYFDIQIIEENVLDTLNKALDDLYPLKVVQKTDKQIPSIQDVINRFDSFEFMLLPHGGQSHATFDTSIPDNVKFDTTLQKSIYYNQFEGFTARGDSKLEKTQDYFKRLGINDFVHLITCSDNYNPAEYPDGKEKIPFKPTWMLAKPTFHGLRLSLSEQSRLIYSYDRPRVGSEHIKHIKLQRPNIDIDVNLTPGLNVIIGDSSSGKTLLVDSLVRCLIKDTEGSPYSDYEVDKMEIDNPSGMAPHYLSQNYIVSVVNDISENNVENIEIIRRVFPGDESIKEKINDGLRQLKQNITNLLQQVKILEREGKDITRIPILSRLIVKGPLQHNIFESLLPKADEIESLSFSEMQFKKFSGTLEEVKQFLKRYPLVSDADAQIDTLKQLLESAFDISSKEQMVRSLIQSEKDQYDDFLRQHESEEQTKKQNFDSLLTSLTSYVGAYRSFFECIAEISSYALRIDSEVIESSGHKLYIENAFELTGEKFIATVNAFLRDPIASVDEISPDRLFESNLRKKNPKVSGHDDLEHRIYNSFEKLNKKHYKIITNDGRDFDTLSPGWKTSIILDLILSYDKDTSPIIIDQPEDNLAITYINEGLVSAVKKIKAKKQVILVSHNATIPMLADAQNIILCRVLDQKIVIRSNPLEGEIDGKSVVDYIAEITDGGKPAIKKRVKKYNLKKFA